jgi:type IV pilus assembly protein PilV
MKRLKSESGVTLIEILIAVTILAIGLLGVAGLQVTAIKGNSHGNTISQATAIAEEQVEIIRNMDYSEVTFDPNPFVENNVDGTIYTRTTEVEDNTPLNDLKRVTVTVSWTAGNKNRQVQLRTIVSNEG